MHLWNAGKCESKNNFFFSLFHCVVMNETISVVCYAVNDDAHLKNISKHLLQSTI